MKSNKKGQVGLMVVFVVVALTLILLAAFISPMLALFNAKMYEEGERLLLKENATIAGIQNEEVRTALYGSIDNALGATQENIEINNSVFQYSWIFILFLTALIIFIYARALTIQSGGGAV